MPLLAMDRSQEEKCLATREIEWPAEGTGFLTTSGVLPADGRGFFPDRGVPGGEGRGFSGARALVRPEGSGAWAIGVLVGIKLLFAGRAVVALSAAAGSVAEEAETAATG